MMMVAIFRLRTANTTCFRTTWLVWKTIHARRDGAADHFEWPLPFTLYYLFSLLFSQAARRRNQPTAAATLSPAQKWLWHCSVGRRREAAVFLKLLCYERLILAQSQSGFQDTVGATFFSRYYPE